MSLTTQERELLRSIRNKTEELAKFTHQATQLGFSVGFNINAATGTVDKFDISRMMPVNLNEG